MACKNFNAGDGYCYKSCIMLDSGQGEGPENIPMQCEFSGDPQKCLDGLIELNNNGIVWPDYAIVRIRQTNPHALEFKRKQENESK